MVMFPLIFVDLSSNRVSAKENRMLADFPQWSVIKNRPIHSIKLIDAWFKDSTGFREQLVKLYNIMDKNIWLNGIRYTDGEYVYLVGEKGHHYFAHVAGRLIPKFQGKSFLSDDQLVSMAIKLEEVKKYLQRKGIQLVVMFCADKESVYPEFYPKSIKRGSEPIQLDVITNYLLEHTSVDIFNIRQALMAEKNNYLLYYLVDTKSFTGAFAHYNEIGAFFSYQELMRHIHIYFPKIIHYSLNDIVISYNDKGIPKVTLKAEKNYKKLDASFFDNIDLIRPFSWENEAYENIDTNLPVILFLCDSYASEQFIGKYIAQHFGKTIMIHNRDMNHLEEYIEIFKPDIVVFESAERELRGFASSVSKIPELLTLSKK